MRIQLINSAVKPPVRMFVIEGACIKEYIGNNWRHVARCNSPRHAIRSLIRMGVEYKVAKGMVSMVG